MERLKYDKFESHKHPSKDAYIFRWFKKNLLSYNRRKRTIQIGGYTFIKELLIDGFDYMTNSLCVTCTIRYGQLIPKKEALFDKGYIYCPECDGDYGE